MLPNDESGTAEELVNRRPAGTFAKAGPTTGSARSWVSMAVRFWTPAPAGAAMKREDRVGVRNARFTLRRSAWPLTGVNTAAVLGVSCAGNRFESSQRSAPTRRRDGTTR